MIVPAALCIRSLYETEIFLFRSAQPRRAHRLGGADRRNARRIHLAHGGIYDAVHGNGLVSPQSTAHGFRTFGHFRRLCSGICVPFPRAPSRGDLRFGVCVQRKRSWERVRPLRHDRRMGLDPARLFGRRFLGGGHRACAGASEKSARRHEKNHLCASVCAPHYAGARVPLGTVRVHGRHRFAHIQRTGVG